MPVCNLDWHMEIKSTSRIKTRQHIYVIPESCQITLGSVLKYVCEALDHFFPINMI